MSQPMSSNDSFKIESSITAREKQNPFFKGCFHHEMRRNYMVYLSGWRISFVSVLYLDKIICITAQLT